MIKGRLWIYGSLLGLLMSPFVLEAKTHKLRSSKSDCRCPHLTVAEVKKMYTSDPYHAKEGYIVLLQSFKGAKELEADVEKIASVEAKPPITEESGSCLCEYFVKDADGNVINEIGLKVNEGINEEEDNLG